MNRSQKFLSKFNEGDKYQVSDLSIIQDDPFDVSLFDGKVKDDNWIGSYEGSRSEMATLKDQLDNAKTIELVDGGIKIDGKLVKVKSKF